METLIKDLQTALKTITGWNAVLMPQKAGGSTKRIELWFAGITSNEDPENRKKPTASWKMTFTANLVSKGTHAAWVSDVCKASMILAELEEQKIPIGTKGVTAYWKRNGIASMQYASEDEQAMPEIYQEPYLVTIDFPAHLLTEDTP